MTVQEPALAYGKQYITLEEYLEAENASEEKHEYYKGEIFAMAGAKLPHNIVAGNLYYQLRLKLKGKPCQPYNSDTRIHIPNNTLVTYPDITIICGEPETLNGDDMTVLNPSVLIEVLSPSTAEYNKGKKFMMYRDITTLKDYIMADPANRTVECWFINSSGFWQQQVYTLANGTFHINSLQLELVMEEVFDGLK